jgi:hypothetical protein
MASMTDGTLPVGKTYTVVAANSGDATEQAWRAAEAAGRELGVTLHTEQVEAGKWDVTLQDNGPAGAGIPPKAPLTEEIGNHIQNLARLGLQSTPTSVVLLKEARNRIEALEATIQNMLEDEDGPE